MPAAQGGGKDDNDEAAPTYPHLYALINYEDPYVQPLILSAMDKLFAPGTWTLLRPPPAAAGDAEISLASLLPDSSKSRAKILQISPYESIDFGFAAAHPATCLVNSYVIRKALIRKHFLAATVETWAAKHPASALRTHVKRAEAFEVDYAEFLDDALVEAWDLRASMERNAAIAAAAEGGRGAGGGGGAGSDDGDDGDDGVAEQEQERIDWWILKPSMSDRGQGIRLFSTMRELEGIFDGWEADMSGSDDDDDGQDEEEGGHEGGGAAAGEEEGRDHGITTSHLRHFIAQPYIHPPLLLPELGNRKFHIRVYVVAVGSLRVYVYRDMLALFAAKPYRSPRRGDDDGDLDAHLTNTCLQNGDGGAADAVHRFRDLPLTRDLAESVCAQICEVTGELFEAAARGMMVHFQPLAHAFEVYGLDFLVDARGTAWLLEVNAFPDFKQTGGELTSVVAGFWWGVLRLAVVPFASNTRDGRQDNADDNGMVLVRDIDLGRRWGPS